MILLQPISITLSFIPISLFSFSFSLFFFVSYIQCGVDIVNTVCCNILGPEILDNRNINAGTTLLLKTTAN